MSEEKRPEWMTSISANVDPDEYLSGRKIDKTFELGQEEKAKRAKEIREELIASNKLKLAADPILELERRKQQLKLELMSNPLKLKKFREHLLKEEREKRGESSQIDTLENGARLSSKRHDDRSGKESIHRRNVYNRRRSPSSSSSSTKQDNSPSTGNARDGHRSDRNRYRNSKSETTERYHRDHNSRHRQRRSHDRDDRRNRSRDRNSSRHRRRSRSSEHNHKQSSDSRRRSHHYSSR